jgi:hypothetical protein
MMARIRPARWALLLVVAIALLIGAGILLLAPPQTAALPTGATPLVLRTQPWALWPPSGFGCPMATVTPMRMVRDGEFVAFADEASGNRLPIVWPSGFSARLLDGRAELVRPNGSALARDGDVISNLASSAADNGDILICFDFASAPLVVPSS